MAPTNEGAPLDQYLLANGPIPYSKAGRIIIAALQELQQREARGSADIVTVIHPGRLMVTGGKVVILDDPQLTASPEVDDTLTPYMSPEELADGTIDKRSTLYSVGCSLYELLTGQKPFPFTDPDEIGKAHIETKAPDPRSVHSGVPVSVAKAVRQLMEKSPRRRPQDFAAAILELKRSVGMTPIASAPSQSPTQAARSSRQRIGSRGTSVRHRFGRSRVERSEPAPPASDDSDHVQYGYPKRPPNFTYYGLGVGVLLSVFLIVFAVSKSSKDTSVTAAGQRKAAEATKGRIVERRRSESALVVYQAEEKKAAAHLRRLLNLPHSPALKRDALEQSLTRFYHVPSGRRIADEYLRLYELTSDRRDGLRTRKKDE